MQDWYEEYLRIKREVYSNHIDLDINFINEVNNYLTDLEIRLFNEGLDESDIEDIEKTIKLLYDIDYDISTHIRGHLLKTYIKEQRYYDLISYQRYLLKVIGDIGIRLVRILRELRLTTGEYSIKDYIKDNSSLLHLVSTNNHSNQHIRKVSNDSFFYLCQFHNERRSSMRVYNNSNRLYCYGCGIGLNIFKYLRDIEGLSLKDAMLLLAEINKINIGENRFNPSSELVKKYNNERSLKRYEMRVIAGRNRASNRPKTLNNYVAMDKYNQEIDTIRRIRENEYISLPNSKEKKLRYEME